MFTTTYKNMKNFASEILKRTRPGKSDVEESTHIEGCVNPKIQENHNLTPKNSLAYYYDSMLLKNKCSPFRNCHRGKI